MSNVYQFIDYKEFLNDRLDALDEGGRGARARMSRDIGCQTAYTTRVLRGPAHFSLEQGEAINGFLGHTDEQGYYFLLLLQLAKAGTPALHSRFQKLAEKVRENQSLLKNRLEVKENLAEREQLIFYSSWVYSAAHALISIPGFQTAEKIGQRLGISVGRAGEVIEFLLQAGLIARDKKGELTLGKKQTHLGADSPLISKHHTNWRVQAIRAIEQNPRSGLHYSSVVSLSQKDLELVNRSLVETIQKIKKVIRDSKEEKLASFSLDLFTL